MQKLLLAAGFLFLTLFAASQTVIYDANAQVRAVSSFHAVSVSNSFEVIITQGNDEKVAVSANDEKYVADISTKVENGVLVIRFSEGKKLWRSNPKLKAYIAVKNLDEIRGSGAVDIKINNVLNTHALKVDISGASRLRGQVAIANKLAANLSGASTMVLTGSAGETAVEAHGASDIKAFDFNTAICNIEASGASDIQITVEKELSARLSGASTVNYKGSAMIRDIKTSGASSISRKS